MNQHRPIVSLVFFGLWVSAAVRADADIQIVPGTVNGYEQTASYVADANGVLHSGASNSNLTISTNPGSIGPINSSVADGSGDSVSVSSGPYAYSYDSTSISGYNSGISNATLGTGRYAEGDADASFAAQFTVGQTSNFVLESSLMNVGVNGNDSIVESLFDVSAGDSLVFHGSSGNYSDTGVLTPGDNYSFEIQANSVTQIFQRSPGTDGASSSYNFYLQVTPVPEPVSYSLLFIGALGLISRPRRTA